MVDTQSMTALLGHGPVKIQSGAKLLLHAVTSDNYALYQEGQTLYATKLTVGARRTLVAQVPSENIAQVLQVGKVVFVWTDPQRELPGFGVSPLVLFTAQGGARVISSMSAVGLVATAASADDRQIVFPTNTTPDGLRGDLAHAFTNSPLAPSIVLHDIPLDFPFGTCRPLAGFGSAGKALFPIAAYCAGTDTTATLSKWVDGVKTDLVSGIVTPMPFRLDGNPQGTRFLIDCIDGTVEAVNASGDTTVVDNVISKQGFITAAGTIGYTTVPSAAGQPAELRLALGGNAPRTVAEVARLYVGLHNRSGYYRRETTSRDGRWALFGSNLDTGTGSMDMHLLDVRSGDVVDLGAKATAAVGSEIFTRDSSHAFFVARPDQTANTGTLFAANRNGARPISADDTVSDALAASGSRVSFTDKTVYDPQREFLLSTGDLQVVDTADTCVTPRLIAHQVNLMYWPSHDRRAIAFTSDNESGGPGLYLASAEP
jgi:hypothetical protein